MTSAPTIKVTSTSNLWMKPEDWSMLIQALGECKHWALAYFIRRDVFMEMVIERGYEIPEEDRIKV